ncbi:hypothetical protein T484DRAFT_1894662, partial [Baffinella frigidus]
MSEGMFGSVAKSFGFGDQMENLDPNVEVTHQSFGEKLSSAFCGIGVGIVLVLGALGLAGWNEYRNVATLRTISEGRDVVVKDVLCSPIDVNNHGMLVHLACDVTGAVNLAGNGTLGLMGVSAIGYKLEKYTEQNAWKETKSSKTTKDKVGGGSTTKTTYSYSQEWTTMPATGKTANNGVRCVNPAALVPLGSAVLGTAPAKMGDFKMSEYVVSQAMSSKTLTPSCSGGNVCGTKMVTESKYIYTPETRVRTGFTLGTMTDATVVAKQKEPDTFEQWYGTYDPDYGIYQATAGKKTAEEMFTAQEEANDAVTWILRVVSLVLVIVGLQMVTAPLTVVADIIPVIGPMISGMIGSFLCMFNTGIGPPVSARGSCCTRTQTRRLARTTTTVGPSRTPRC